ncbi:Bifunctional epoxide hydrolase 2 [Linum perenne]
MEQINHKFVQVGGGLKLHVADVGTGDKVVLLLHGFPEIWYSWRHQMIALSKAGYRAIAPDYRGYGLSDPPPNPQQATFADFAADIAAVLDSLEIPKVVVVAKDFGAYVASRFAVVYPEKMLGLVTMGIPYTPPGPGASAIMALLPEGFYARRWMEHGRAEADFDRFDAKTLVRKIYILFAGEELPTAAENQEIFDLVDPSDPLPCWFTEDDLSTYGALYQKSGFHTALKVPYRSMDEAADIADPTVKVPAMLILGDKDYVNKTPGFEDYANNGVKHFVQDLKIIHLSEGSHFVQEQFPEQVNELVLGFLKTRIWS